MATPYIDIIPLVRAAIGDFGIRDAQGNIVQSSQDFHADDISLAINYVLLRFPDYSGDGTDITPTLANDNDTGAIATYVALIMALPGGTFSMETPNQKYWVQANQDLLSHLLGQIKYFMDGGDITPSIWGTLDLCYNEAQIISDRIVEAIDSY